MRASPEIRPHLLAAAMKRWLDIARCPIMNTNVPTWRARKNYRNLVRRYPQIAAACGFTEALSVPSPLHDLRSSLQQQEPQQAPRQEFPIGSPNTDVTNPAHTERFVEQITGPQPEPPVSCVPRLISLEDEIL